MGKKTAPDLGLDEYDRQQTVSLQTDPRKRLLPGAAVRGDSTITIKNDPARAFDNMTAAQRIAKKRRDLGELDPVAPDLADLAVRDQQSGRVRRARGGSRRSSLLGDTKWALPPVGESSLLGDM